MTAQDTLNLLVRMVERVSADVSDLKSAQTRIETTCEARGVCNEDVKDRLESLEKSVAALQVNEWKIYFRLTFKLAAFIIILGSTALFLYQVYEKVRNPAAPVPSMPSLP